jgi:hypothetical protein
MADVRVSALPATTTLVDADEFYVNDGGASRKITAANVGVYMAAELGSTFAAASHNHAASEITSGTVATAQLGSGTANSSSYLRGDQKWAALPATPVTIGIAVGDETTAITTGTAKVTFRMPHAMTLTAVRASLTTASSSGIPTVDINEGGSTILSTKLTIDASEKTSTTAATAAVISDTALADDAEMTIDIDVAGTDAAGLKVWLIGTRA